MGSQAETKEGFLFDKKNMFSAGVPRVVKKREKRVWKAEIDKTKTELPDVQKVE